MPEVSLDLEFADPSLELIADKVLSGKRLTRQDGEHLFASPDFLGVGRLADHARQLRHGLSTYFVLNRHINPTNICVLSCRFCEFQAKPADSRAYELTLDEILARCAGDIREVHIVGGHHIGWPFEKYVGIVRAIHEAYPQLQIKAWTAPEIDFFTKITRKSVEEVLGILREAGLLTMPGGGAEVFSERVRRELFKGKIGADRWLDIHRRAHRLGFRTNCTMLYGHIETHAERVEHLLRLRELQDETGGFQAFVPLAFQPGRTGLVRRAASAVEDLRTVAVARLLLDNVPHLKSYWVMLGEDTASVALQFGADDLDGTIGEEKIVHAHRDQARSAVGHTRDELVRMIREAQRVPVERDALYGVVGTFA
ncbi:MAG TPA: aminofutalosine synthase MqnE [Candidatus Saccharimonadales bacterium]|nr:aminofutalosine synthase MqnE [Candidatus Saccharimonadales bacterium]